MAECGTYAGYQQHGKRREPACEPCKKASRDYQWVRRGREDALSVKRERAYSRAANRALQDLRRAHPVEYTMLLETHLVATLQEVGVDG